jgi:hypothetical protein
MEKKIRCYELLFAVQTSDTFFEDIRRLLLTRDKLSFLVLSFNMYGEKKNKMLRRIFEPNRKKLRARWST